MGAAARAASDPPDRARAPARSTFTRSAPSSSPSSWPYCPRHRSPRPRPRPRPRRRRWPRLPMSSPSLGPQRARAAPRAPPRPPAPPSHGRRASALGHPLPFTSVVCTRPREKGAACSRRPPARPADAPALAPAAAAAAKPSPPPPPLPGRPLSRQEGEEMEGRGPAERTTSADLQPAKKPVGANGSGRASSRRRRTGAPPRGRRPAPPLPTPPPPHRGSQSRRHCRRRCRRRPPPPRRPPLPRPALSSRA